MDNRLLGPGLPGLIQMNRAAIGVPTGRLPGFDLGPSRDVAQRLLHHRIGVTGADSRIAISMEDDGWHRTMRSRARQY